MSQFPLSLLQAVCDWQRGGSASQIVKRGQKLKEESASLSKNYRTCSLCLYRQIGLPPGGVWSLIGENRLPEKISSWTLSLEMAKAFKGGVPPEGQGYQGVIFCVLPPPDSVIVNLHELYRDPAFIAALEMHKGSITGYHDGAGRYGNDQSEVVLEIASMTQEDIYSMGGHSSPFDELVDEAAKLIHGRPATPEEREALMLKVEHVRSEAGPRWLGPQATQCVVTKMKPHAESLLKVRREQDSAG